MTLEKHPLVEIIGTLKKEKPVYYGSVILKLDVARTGKDSEAVDVVGDFLNVESIDGTSVSIIFNEPGNPLISLNNQREFVTPFYRFFITHTAQAGKTVKVNFGRDASFVARALSPVRIANLAGLDIDPAIKDQYLYLFTPLEVASQHGVAETADTDILVSDITPTNTPCLFRIFVMLETSGVFSVMLTSGAVTKKLMLSTGVALVASCAYLFDILVHSGDTVNFQSSASGNVTLRVQEIVGGVQ